MINIKLRERGRERFFPLADFGLCACARVCVWECEYFKKPKPKFGLCTRNKKNTEIRSTMRAQRRPPEHASHYHHAAHTHLVSTHTGAQKNGVMRIHLCFEYIK